MMDNSKIKEKIIELLSNLFYDFDVDEDVIEYADLIDDLGMDSVNFISLIIELETEFNIQIPDDWLLVERFREFSLIFSAVKRLIEKRTEGNNCEQ